MLRPPSRSSPFPSTPLFGSVWGVFQLPAVKVRLEAETVPSAVLLLLSGIVTLAVGWLVRTTVNVAAPPASVVTRPDEGLTVIPAVSLSVLLTGTSAGFVPRE